MFQNYFMIFSAPAKKKPEPKKGDPPTFTKKLKDVVQKDIFMCSFYNIN